MGRLVATFVLSYLIGSVPVGLLVSRFWGRDLRQHGSRNIGTSNALRVLGPVAAVITLIGDGGKGVLGGCIGLLLVGSPWAMVLGTLGAIFGQTYPLYLLFKGGKGVATTIGSALILSPLMGSIMVGVWILIVALTRYISLASMVAALSSILIVFFLKLPPAYYFFAVVAGGHVVYRHQDNIKRLLAGKEFKIGERV
ncbi:MAG: glycerol-3-phosphate 1-O-acyltransferase PlsY [Firmicutes bacterium]|nr:glycerol-3-phosphate 1-O-acyltransferase PlsY [Bacillota bacterium]